MDTDVPDLTAAAQAIDPEQLRETRRLERQLASAQAAARLERAKRLQAEMELAEAQQREELLLALKDEVTEYTLEPLPARGGKPGVTAVICCTDWHAEEHVEPSLANERNAFDLEICQRRVSKMWHKAIERIRLNRKEVTIDDAVLWFGGDLISGAIHPELEETNLLGPTEAVTTVKQLMRAGIQELLGPGRIKRLHVIVNMGNHSRTTPRKRHASGYRHSWEYLLAHDLADWFSADTRVTWQIPKGYHAYTTIRGWTVRFHHGDAIGYSGGVGGITIPVNKKIPRWNSAQPADFDVFGHFHQYMDTWTWTSCGCLVGYNAFAVQIGAGYQVPTQTLILIDEKHGKSTVVPIYVD